MNREGRISAAMRYNYIAENKMQWKPKILQCNHVIEKLHRNTAFQKIAE